MLASERFSHRKPAECADTIASVLRGGVIGCLSYMLLQLGLPSVSLLLESVIF